MIKPRRYSMELYRRTDNDYLPATLEHVSTRIVTMPPTVRSVTGIAAHLFPDLDFDTRWESMRDILADAREYGYTLFSFSLIRPGDPREITYTLSFLEV